MGWENWTNALKPKGMLKSEFSRSNDRVLISIRRLFCVMTLILGLQHLSAAQERTVTQQLWLDFVADFYVGDIGLLDVGLSFNQWAGKRNEWNEIMITPIYEMYPSYRLDVFAGVLFSRVKQEPELITVETRPIAGFRFNFSTQRNRAFIRYRFRYEWRHFQYNFTDSTEVYNRVRNRLEANISLTQENYQKDDNLYLKVDFEIFTNLDSPPGERFVNNSRTRLGLGYRLNEAWRFEALYTLQLSQNNLEQNGPESVDHIFRLLFKKYFFY